MQSATLRELLPTRREEAWKYSDLRAALAEAELPPLRAEAVGASIIQQLAPDNGAIRQVIGSEVVVDRFDSNGLDARVGGYTLLPGADLTRVVMQTGSGVPLSSCFVFVGAGARFRQFVLAEGGKLARVETIVSVVGEGAEVELNGVYLVNSERHADLTSVITHKARGGTTRQLIKGVARKGGRGVFQGKIVVERGAQRTDARQYHRGILLEDGAEIFAKPELMIHADDVQCAHGNTAGGLDESALFYMRSRGIAEADARALLIEAFLVEAIPAGLPDELHDELTGLIRAWLTGDAASWTAGVSPANGGATSPESPAGTPAVQEP